jgi:tRNA pseudouridine38-40 synthase
MTAASDDAKPLPSVVLDLAYDGRGFSGFARQTNGRTIAGCLEAAIRTIDPDASLVRAASRTDRGVHARLHPVSFDPQKQISPRGWTLALNERLPDEIAVTRARLAPRGFDPRRSAWKRYKYLLLLAPNRDPLWIGRAWRLHERLNQTAMQRAASLLEGEHDFAAFRGARDERKFTVRRLVRVEVRNASSDERLLEVEVTGTAFLYKMVRIIVGTLVDIGRGRLDSSAIERAFQSKDRADLGMTAPAEGLYLEHVELAVETFDAWPEHG